MIFGGMQIIEDINMVMQVRFPRSKKKRIKKKWSKDKKNYGPSTEIFQTANRFIMHPMIAEQFKRQMVL